MYGLKPVPLKQREVHQRRQVLQEIRGSVAVSLRSVPLSQCIKELCRNRLLTRQHRLPRILPQPVTPFTQSRN